MSGTGVGGLSGVAAYYSGRALEFGATPLGVDWTCAATQEMRFVQLLKLCDFGSGFSLNDVGCGYGALLGFLRRAHLDCAVDYLGIDVSDEMVRLAAIACAEDANATAIQASSSPRAADYSVASGIFNVCLDEARDVWEGMIADTLGTMARTSRRGFAVNFLAPRPERAGLYGTEPARWAGHCADVLGGAPEVVGGYGMAEFTLLVRTAPARPVPAAAGR